MPSIEKLSLQMIVDNCTPNLIGAVIVFLLTVWLILKINKLVGSVQSIIEVLVSSVHTLEKQQRKGEQIITALPCVQKANATWLQDPQRNGGQPPEKITCPSGERQ